MKSKVTLRCPDCDKEIIGFSQKHADKNLMIHKQTSQRHKEIIALLKKKGLKG